MGARHAVGGVRSGVWGARFSGVPVFCGQEALPCFRMACQSQMEKASLTPRKPGYNVSLHCEVQVCHEATLSLSFLICDQGLLDPICLPGHLSSKREGSLFYKTCPSRQREMLQAQGQTRNGESVISGWFTCGALETPRAPTSNDEGSHYRRPVLWARHWGAGRKAHNPLP